MNRVQPTHQHDQHRRADWRDDAACRDADPELFFPTASSGPAYERQVAEAKAVCDGCTVAPECLDEAMTPADEYGLADGVAGGLDEHERREAWTEGQRMRAALDLARATVNARTAATGNGDEANEARRAELARWHTDDQTDDLASDQAAEMGEADGLDAGVWSR